MTREERAIDVFKSKLEWAKEKRYPFISNEEVEAYKLAIQALEQEPSGDLISRQGVFDALEKVANFFPYKTIGKRETYDKYNEAWNDAIGRAEMEIERLPSVKQQEPKTGYWILLDECSNSGYYCSECQKKVVK